LYLSLNLPFAALATPYNEIFIFGDSLSDQGNVAMLTGGDIPGTDYFNGRFSNGPVYADMLGQRLGLPVTPLAFPILSPPYPAWSPGYGNNFAYGGARTDRHRTGLPLGLNSQVSAFANGVGTADGDALYIVFAGANDIQDAIGVSNDNPVEAAAAMADPSGAIARAENAALNVANAISDLAATGALSFLVPNIPNWALVPAVTELELNHPSNLAGLGSFAMDVTLAFNDQLADQLSILAADNPTIDIMAFDLFDLFQDMVNDPALYGFTDVSTSCYDGDDLAFSGGGTACANPGEFLFWDRIHPTTATHAIFTDKIASAIPEPASIFLVLLGLSGLIVGKRRFSRYS
jgi:phospholipase/lecithinase/hemolysin